LTTTVTLRAKDLYMRDLEPFVERLEQWTAQQASSIAVIASDGKLTYGELRRRARLIAGRLRSLGVQRGDAVGIYHERNSELVPCIVGVLMAGCAYLPLDPAYPQDRVAFMTMQARVPVIIASASTRDRATTWFKEASVVSSNDLQAFSTTEIPIEHRDPSIGPEDAAYVIFTSGSTGVPKGVVIEHRSLSNFLHWCEMRFTRTRLARVMATSSLCFDSSVFEIFAALWAGGTIVVIESALHAVSFPDLPGDTLFSCAPSVAHELLRGRWVPDGVTAVVLAGEKVPDTLVERLEARFHGITVYNCYGLTEATVFSTLAELRSDSPRPFSAGGAILNTQIYILDEHRRPVCDGTSGEIYIGGCGLARGYLNRPDLSQERFVENPFRCGERLLRTGDTGYLRAEGDLVCTGRMDEQVKIYGFRIEPGEIETHLCLHPDVAQCVVLSRPTGTHEVRLVAYYVPRREANLTEALRSFLQGQLPQYMVPSQFISVHAIPLNPSGKVDRAALRELPL
jgi:amino acid adenylation domain-containing protein